MMSPGSHGGRTSIEGGGGVQEHQSRPRRTKQDDACINVAVDRSGDARQGEGRQCNKRMDQ